MSPAHGVTHAAPKQRGITLSSQRSKSPLTKDGLIAALDIGGTKIAGALVDRDGVLIHRARRTTPAREPADVLLGAVHDVLGSLAASPLWERVGAVGIGSAGPIDLAHGTVSPVNIPAWRNFPIAESVARHPDVGRRQVTLAGDAVAMTAAEHRHGAARGHRNALCLVVSTGVGAGLVLNGSVHHGLTGNAGHLGHISIDFDGEACPCGARGCLEAIASGTAITRHALALGWQAPLTADTAGVAASARACRSSRHRRFRPRHPRTGSGHCRHCGADRDRHRRRRRRCRPGRRGVLRTARSPPSTLRGDAVPEGAARRARRAGARRRPGRRRCAGIGGRFTRSSGRARPWQSVDGAT